MFICFANNLLRSLSVLLIFPCNSQHSKVNAPFQVFYVVFLQKIIFLFSKQVTHISVRSDIVDIGFLFLTL